MELENLPSRISRVQTEWINKQWQWRPDCCGPESLATVRWKKRHTVEKEARKLGHNLLRGKPRERVGRFNRYVRMPVAENRPEFSEERDDGRTNLIFATPPSPWQPLGKAPRISLGDTRMRRYRNFWQFFFSRLQNFCSIQLIYERN